MSSPSYPSPGRMSRPHWPWSTYSAHQSSSSIHSTSSSQPSGTRVSSSWESRTSVGSPMSHPGTPHLYASRHSSALAPPAAAPLPEETTRHWTFTAFEWVVRDVLSLKSVVEGEESAEGASQDRTRLREDTFEVLKESPLLGDGKFKLEIARTPVADNHPNHDGSSQQHNLWLSITSMDDFAEPETELSASIMAAIKCQDDRVGERGARADWVWETWQNEFIFRAESELWECPLPSLTSLLENPRIQETNSFVICIQIHSPTGPFFPQQPSAYYVPRDLLDGLEASLDNPNTGDVRFLCLERLEQKPLASPNLSASMTESRRSSSTSSSMQSHSRTTARKRIIYAHSDILTRRSEYFATMLASSFAENAPVQVPGERKIYTVVVEEADFVTIYWLLKWVYANWLLFKEDDDPRTAIDGVGAGWSTKWLNTRGSEWEWKTFSKNQMVDDGGDSRSVTSTDSAGAEGTTTVGGKGKGAGPSGTPVVGLPVPPSAPRSPSSSKLNARSPNLAATSTSARRAVSASGPALTGAAGSSPRPKPVTVPVPSSSSHYPLSPSKQRHSTVDPHVHPTPQPSPASALSMYQTAHRYGLAGLANLALEHLMSSITPRSSFALLLATSLWEELHSLVEDYVVERWDEVSVTHEFEQCCEEVAAGEWGNEGGKTLMTLFRRLRSPSALNFARS